jgi:Nitrile hydratase beta subunit
VSDLVRPEVQQMAGAAALPRENGELVFDAPWQGRVLGMALAVVQQRGLDWDGFRQRLIAAIDADPRRPYYESWTVALAEMVVDVGVISEDELTKRTHRQASRTRAGSPATDSASRNAPPRLRRQ